MDINCPHCGTGYECGESEYGRFVKCATCGKGFVAGTSAAKKIGEAAKAANEAMRIASNTVHERIKNVSWGKLFSKIKSSVKAFAKSAMSALAMSANGEPSLNPELQMISEDICRGNEARPTAEGECEQGKFDAERGKLRELEYTYVCTHCGEISTSPKQTRLGCLGALGVILAFICGAFFAMIHPIIGIAVFIVCLVASCVRLAQSNKTYCKKCGKYDTMISAMSPQGRRLLNEYGHDLGEASTVSSTESSQLDVAERLKRLQKLLADGLVSDDEYKAQRQHILDSI